MDDVNIQAKITVRRQKICLVVISILAALLMMEILSGLFGKLWMLGIFAFVLVPAVFAYPIILRRPMWLLIPVGLIPTTFIVIPSLIHLIFEHGGEWSFGDIAAYAFIMSIICFLLALFGMGVGGFVRIYRKKKSWSRLAIMIIGASIFGFIPVGISYAFMGAPIHSAFVNRTVRAYVAEVYSDFDLIVGRTRLTISLGGAMYQTRIHCANNRQFYFLIWYTRSGGLRDRCTMSRFWESQYMSTLRPLIDTQFGDDIWTAYMTIDRGQRIGEKFDMHAPGSETTINIGVANIADMEATTIAAEFRRFHLFLMGLGYYFTNYHLLIRRPEGGRNLWIRVRAEYINDELSTLIEYMRSNVNERGAYNGGQRGISYSP